MLTDLDIFFKNDWNEIPDLLYINANKRIINPDEFAFAGSFGL